MTNLYDNLEEIDDELCLILDEITAIREMMEDGRQEEALSAMKDLEERFEDFMEIDDEELEGPLSDEDEDAVTEEQAHDQDCACQDCQEVEDFHEVVCRSLASIADAITSLDARLTQVESLILNEAHEEEGERKEEAQAAPSDPEGDDEVGVWHKVGQMARQRC